MNKYQEALKTIEAMFIPVIETDKIYGEYHSMEHLYNTEVYKDNKKYFDLIRELIDKETPMKPVYRIPDISWNKNEKLAHCPACDWRLDWEQGCHNNKCRQRIDWSDEE